MNKKELRRIEVKRGCVWLECKMKDLRPGDTFRMFEEGKLVRFNRKTNFKAVSKPYYEHKVWGIDIETTENK
jgi:hypothetical protein